MSEQPAILFECDAPACGVAEPQKDVKVDTGPGGPNRVWGDLPEDWLEMEVAGKEVQICPRHNDLTVSDLLGLVCEDPEGDQEDSDDGADEAEAEVDETEVDDVVHPGDPGEVRSG